MTFKEIIGQSNIFQECRKYNLRLWECPSFLFSIMGLVIIIAIVATYQIGTRYIQSPEIVALIVLVVVVILLIMNFSITKSFEKLAEANRMKSEFISIVSHQLRSPLVNLRWAIDYLMSEKDKINQEKQDEYFNVLKENTARMGKLISDLLIVSRMESSGFPLEKAEVSLEKIVEEILLEFKPFIEACNIQMELQIEDGLPKVIADFDKIKIVVENFLSNATRYVSACEDESSAKTKRGEVKIIIKRKEQSVYFEVEDNGIGIPKNDHKYIFQKFFRARNALRHQTQGTGLGLHIAKSIIEKSKGKIGFKSKEDKGSVFWFTVPIKN
ncbi:HAMP domain-containing histidine kinase [Candidatus Parcubacteria bacterium]|nr:HAMP domain-containing histidine kinase [Candidatus Parcubacteria bacterium]